MTPNITIQLWPKLGSPIQQTVPRHPGDASIHQHKHLPHRAGRGLHTPFQGLGHKQLIKDVPGLLRGPTPRGRVQNTPRAQDNGHTTTQSPRARHPALNPNIMWHGANHLDPHRAPHNNEEHTPFTSQDALPRTTPHSRHAHTRRRGDRKTGHTLSNAALRTDRPRTHDYRRSKNEGAQ